MRGDGGCTARGRGEGGGGGEGLEGGEGGGCKGGGGRLQPHSVSRPPESWRCCTTRSTTSPPSLPRLTIAPGSAFSDVDV